jgi:hypothetical protein
MDCAGRYIVAGADDAMGGVGVEFSPVADGVWGVEEGVGVVFDGQGDAVLSGGVGVGFHEFEELFDACLGFRARDVFRAFGGADDEVAAEAFEHGHFRLETKGAERVAGGAEAFDLVLGQQLGKGIDAHFIDLLAMGGVLFTPEIEADAPSRGDFGQHLG